MAEQLLADHQKIGTKCQPDRRDGDQEISAGKPLRSAEWLISTKGQPDKHDDDQEISAGKPQRGADWLISSDEPQRLLMNHKCIHCTTIFSS